MASRRGLTLLAGGVGGSRFALALAEAFPDRELTVIGNVGDDLEHWGLHVSPDLDTVLYALAGLVDPEQGWGVKGDTADAMTAAVRFGLPDWFRLGDADLGLKIARTARLATGESLADLTADFALRLGLATRLIPATNDRLRTLIETSDGVKSFHDWFVRRRAADAVLAVHFDGVPAARPAPGVIEAIESAELVLLAPSNPFVSLDPILAVTGVRAAVEARRDRVVAISPLIGGKAVKGPLVAMLASLGHEPTAAGVASYLSSLASGFVVDPADAHLAAEIDRLDLRVAVVPALLRTGEARRAVAEAAVALGLQ